MRRGLLDALLCDGVFMAPDILVMLEESPEGDFPSRPRRSTRRIVASVAEGLPREMVAPFLSALPVERAADVLEYLNEDLRTEVLETMSARQCRRARHGDDSGRSRRRAGRSARRRAPRRFFSEIPTAERVETERLARLRAGYRRRSDDDGVRLGLGRHSG